MFAIRSGTTIEHACQALLEADRLTADALSIIGQVDVEGSTGLPTEMMLVLGARRTVAEARMLVNAAAALRAMPETASAFERGDLSWSQVRAIAVSVRSVDAAGRARIDGLIASNAERLARMDPDELLARVDDAVSALHADLVTAREDRQIERGFFAVQGHLDGSASFYGEADPEATATILEALDAHAGPPATAEDDDAPSRGRQHLDALVSICEVALNGGQNQTTRPRPRLLATIDVESLRRDGDSAGARILWSLAGRPARVSAVATEVLACDATVVPVIFEGTRPLAVGDATAAISSKLRTALIARDGRCRFPSCHAPVAWCDTHHIRARIHDGPTQFDNLVLLCRRCHRRVHRLRWQITMRDDGVIEFTKNGQTYASSPAIPRRE